MAKNCIRSIAISIGPWTGWQFKSKIGQFENIRLFIHLDRW